MGLPSPATGTELYLDAILGELRALRALVEDGGQAPDAPPAAAEVQATEVPRPASPTKRTRARTPRAT